MKKNDFAFTLPPELIAQYPLDKRTDSRLLVYDKHNKQTHHSQFTSLLNWLREGDVLVLNNTKVIPARFFGTKATGGKVEFLFERKGEDTTFYTHIKTSKPLRPNQMITLDNPLWKVTILHKEEDLYLCKANGAVDHMLEEIGHIPLPPYINRSDETQDKERYQTVFARFKGSVAAPTAGLHFDTAILKALEDKGVSVAYLTLHVGAGTFKPVRTETIHDHKMHAEQCCVDATLCDLVNNALAENRRIIAVGTTAMRSLETAGKSGRLIPFNGLTDIFIYPGFNFKICKGLVTNFHLPESTLLMLVSAFIGHPETLQLYQEAIAQKYRFFSYGDACFFF